MKKGIIWTIKDIVEVLKKRQKNQFDGNIIVSGDRGNGKSTLIFKLLNRFGTFNPQKHLVYSREDVIRLLKTQRYGLCWDDEAVNSGYKRNFQNRAQQELIKIVTMYRDNFNIYASAIPNFFSLDKDLREMVFLHLHVIERGIAIVHMPIQGRLYLQDRWDSKNNAKIEMTWTKRMKKDPNFRPPYRNLSTFKGYLYFNKLTAKQSELYENLKREKRYAIYGDITEEEFDSHKDFYDKLIDLLKERKLSTEGLHQICLSNNKSLSTVRSSLSRKLKDQGSREKLQELLNKFGVIDDDKKEKSSEILDIVPEL